ncbi:MAG: serine protease [Candidatus Marinimicrobia bacterium]|nr:serine protease [Candidatus Neomarinimicrobiota bacterium]
MSENTHERVEKNIFFYWLVLSYFKSDKGTRLIKIFIYPLMIVLLSSCSSPLASLPVEAKSSHLVDFTDLFQTGHTQFLATVEQDSSLNKIWGSRREEVVMVFIDIEWDDGEKEQAQQSGILLHDASLILTAGHGFVIDDGKITQVRIRTVANIERVVDVMGFAVDKKKSAPEDWAILKPIIAIEHLSPEPLSLADTGNKVLVLGYPGGLGVTEDDQVIRVQERLSGIRYPLGLVCEQKLFDEHTLYPFAGAVPINGISGAPVYNSEGKLVGIFNSIGRQRNLLGWQYIFWMTEIPWEAIQKFSLN